MSNTDLIERLYEGLRTRDGDAMAACYTDNARFEDGLISAHVDTFSFHAWARQALGPIGWVLGGTPYLRNRVQGQARRNLERFLADDAAGS